MKNCAKNLGLVASALLFLFEGSVAAPALLDPRSISCAHTLPTYCPSASVQSVVSALQKCTSYSAFCSSFITISTSTVTSTSTSTVSTTAKTTVYTGTVVITAPTSTAPTATAPPVTAPPVYITSTVGTTTVTTCASASPHAKRLPNQDAHLARRSPLPSCVSQYQSSDVSSGCTCLCLPTSTTTVHATTTMTVTQTSTCDEVTTTTTTPVTTPTITPTTTPTSTVSVTATATTTYCPQPTPDQSCNNGGLQFAYYYPNPYTEDPSGSYTSFSPENFKTVTPQLTGVASSGGGFSGNCAGANSYFTQYGQSMHCDSFVLDYRGYVYSPSSGPLTLNITAADNIVLAWLGSNAYSGWTRSNALIDLTYPQIPANGFTQTYKVQAYSYVPIRIMFAQGSGPYGFAMSVTTSDGTVLFSAASSVTQYLVQQSCDGTTAPPYAAWGQET